MCEVILDIKHVSHGFEGDISEIFACHPIPKAEVTARPRALRSLWGKYSGLRSTVKATHWLDMLMRS